MILDIAAVTRDNHTQRLEGRKTYLLSK
jgi:hypothetical protein